MMPFFARAITLACALCLSGHASGALPGVTELRAGPDNITDADLSKLLHTRVAAADVIAIGETVHGSSGLLKIQARLIRYLVAQHGLRLIVWENPARRSLEFARWVASCAKANSPPPITVLYMPTAADLPLWEWVCEFNRAHPNDPIVFRGMDVWDRPWEHYANIRALGARVGIAPLLIQHITASCPAAQAASWPEIDAVFLKLNRGTKAFPDADYEQCRALLTTLLNTAQQSATSRKQKKTPDAGDAFELAISASTLLGWLGFYQYERADDIPSWNERDRAQGRNLMLLMSLHDATRAIVSAHSSHVSHNRSPADWWGYGDLKSGVYFFTELTRKKVFNIALTAYRAGGTQGDWSLPTAANSLDKTLHDAGHAFAFFASNAAFLPAYDKWWMQNQNFPGPYESGVEISPADHFDAYFFLDRSLLDEALPQRPMWQP